MAHNFIPSIYPACSQLGGVSKEVNLPPSRLGGAGLARGM
nr:MAG TPA: hypothetical protein [Bacteriophage sp.]